MSARVTVVKRCCIIFALCFLKTWHGCLKVSEANPREILYDWTVYSMKFHHVTLFFNNHLDQTKSMINGALFTFPHKQDQPYFYELLKNILHGIWLKMISKTIFGRYSSYCFRRVLEDKDILFSKRFLIKQGKIYRQSRKI